MKKFFLAVASLCILVLGFQGCTGDLEDKVSELEGRVSNLETAITALQQYTDLLETLNSGDFVVGVVSHTNSYDLKFSSGKSVTITNGKDGQNGNDGQNGQDGKDGAAPKFKIEDETWFVSYDSGATWAEVGSAIDHSLFLDVVVDGEMLFITLADGTIITVPVQILANLESISVTAGGYVVDGVIDNSTSSVTVKCSPKALAAMVEAKITVTATAGATTNVDSDAVYNLVDGVSIIVTAPNGKTHAYAVSAVKGEAEISKVASHVGEITFGSASDTEYNVATNVIAFSGNNIVVTGNKVFDLELNLVGEVNMSGISGFPGSISNDYAGVLTEFIVNGGNTEVYAWFDGYDQPATKIYEIGSADCALYASVSGDYNTGVVITMRAGVSDSQNHHTLLYKKGNAEPDSWAWLSTGLSSTDGNWGQQASAVNYSDNKWGEVQFVVWDSYPGGARIYKKLGTRADTEFVELTNTLNGNGWGNYTVGGVRGYQWEGHNYAAVATSGWPCAYFTIIDLETDSQVYATEALADFAAPTPFPAFVNDAENECAYIALGVNFAENTGVVLYKIAY